jgi:hypothetical protein
MRLLPVVFAAIVLTSPALAGNIVWRSPASGTLVFAKSPPELAIPDPSEPEPDFGVVYGTVKVRAGTSLFIWPRGPSGFAPTGYLFSSQDLPATLTLDVSLGVIRGKISVAGRCDFSVLVADGSGRSQLVPVAVIVE